MSSRRVKPGPRKRKRRALESKRVRAAWRWQADRLIRFTLAHRERLWLLGPQIHEKAGAWTQVALQAAREAVPKLVEKWVALKEAHDLEARTRT